ncbi:MAG: hypothetical protein QXP43_00840 [Nitrososphaerota archaeon]
MTVAPRKPVESAEEAAAIALEMARIANLPMLFAEVSEVVREGEYWRVKVTLLTSGRRYVAKISAATGRVEEWHEEKSAGT